MNEHHCHFVIAHNYFDGWQNPGWESLVKSKGWQQKSSGDFCNSLGDLVSFWS